MSVPPKPSRKVPVRLLVLAALILVGGAGLLALTFGRAGVSPHPSPSEPVGSADPFGRDLLVFGPLDAAPRMTVWWDHLAADVRPGAIPSGTASNVRPSDYVGPETCRQCHADNYQAWSAHPHRWMNALADETTVKGDFSGAASLSYRGGRATFYREDGGFRMGLERGGVRRVYRVTQTIGSRFFQYYVGKLVEGPEPPDHPFYSKDHVLSFGYWLDRKEWVPTVHIGPERQDAEHPDPFKPPDDGRYYAEYAPSCNACHTTFPLGDMLARRPAQMGTHAPVAMHWLVRGYLEESRPDDLRSIVDEMRRRTRRNPMNDWDAPHYAVTLGVSCEACHLGGREHVESGGKVPPKFFPSSPHLFLESDGKPPDFGRTHDNVNWACGRCHTGARPEFAAGMSTWNSVEYSDAMKGSCYSQLRCIDCHEPHHATGPKWTPSADEDDAVCLKCHGEYTPAPERLAHTHHPAGSDGARCLNCHMPRLNEGLQDVVRTHMIYSPTRADMIEANQPNACNLCHADKPMDWTLGRLKEWYGAKYDETKIASAYPERGRPAALGWLKSDNESVRLVAVDSLTRAGDPGALPQLLDALDDPYLVDRQFASKELEDRMGVRPGDFGYHFYMTEEERRGPLAELRKAVLKTSP